ncbi:MAG: hypothetical protein ABI456_08385 [Ktedonobacteraceae bacterium]
MNKHMLKWSFLALVFLLALEMSWSSSPALAAHHSATVSSGARVTTPAAESAVRAYWTPQRMQSALSGDQLLHQAKVAAHAPARTGAAGSQAPTAPHKAVAAQAAAPRIGVAPRAYSLPYPYSFPWSTVGKVFFTDPATGYNYQCSGTATTSHNLSTVDTAGHCVAAGGGRRFYSNWVFCAQYYYGCRTGYLWTARQLWTHYYWYYDGWFAYDYGAAVLNANSSGYAVNVVGGAGWTYGQSYYQYFYAFGYPAAPPFDGGRLWYCPSSLYAFDRPSPGPTTLGITCNMTGGSSGGGWLISIGNTFGYVNGHNDYKYNNDVNHMYSPYYGSDWFAVFNAAQNA